jgi:formylglycine-generating enzyme required for sulfatase activity
MGSNHFYPEEEPAHEVAVDGFWMDRFTVTNADFQRFVEATGYVTLAERPLDPLDYPNALPELLVPGSAVFRQQSHPVDLNHYRARWDYVPGASWRHPEGPGSVTGRLAPVLDYAGRGVTCSRINRWGKVCSLSHNNEDCLRDQHDFGEDLLMCVERVFRKKRRP